MEGYKKFKVRLAGDSLIMHNGQTADPLNAYAKGMKQINSKRKKTEADYKALSDLEFQAGLYLDQKGRVVIPSRVLEASIHGGAKKSKEGQLALSGLFVDTDLVLEYEGGPLSVEKLVASPDHRITVPVKVQRNKVMRTRPHFKNWSGTFDVSLNSQVANQSQFERWMFDLGAYVGLCDWRPRHGRFDVLEIAEIKVPIAAVA